MDDPVWNRWQLHGQDYVLSPLVWPRNKSTTRERLLSGKRSESYN